MFLQCMARPVCISHLRSILSVVTLLISGYLIPCKNGVWNGLQTPRLERILACILYVSPQNCATSHSPSFLGPARLLPPRGTNLPYPFFPTRPPFSLSHTTSPLKIVYLGHCSSCRPSNGV